MTGAPQPHLDIFFIARFRPVLLEGDAIVTERQTVRTDKNGYVQVDLIRGAQYDVVLQALEDSPRRIDVPDRSSVNLPDLIFPVVTGVSFDQPGPWTVAVGTPLLVTPTVALSNGLNLVGTAPSDVKWSSSDTGVFGIALTGTLLTIRAVGPGTANLLAVRMDQSIIRIPATPITGQPVSITVA